MNEEQKETLRTILIGGILFLAGLFPLPGILSSVCFAAAWLVLAFEVLKESWEHIREGEVFNEDFLMCIAALGALAMGDFREAVFIMLFFRVGELFEDAAVDRSRSTIREMLDLRPDHALLEKDGEAVSVSPETVAVNDVILVKPGERIPLDGTILEGSTQIDCSALTGESLPKAAAGGDEVCSGTINLSGVIRVRVDKPFGESTVSRILNLVENAADKKTRSETFITRFARVYTPAVITAAALTALIPPLFFAQGWRVWIHRALIFLVVSCPCAPVISVPLTFYSAIGAAAKKGILIKGSSYLDTLRGVKTMVFDKTGTLTRGVFKVLKVCGTELPEEEMLKYAAYAESYSSHPIALSIRGAYGEALVPDRVRDVEETSGKGVSALVDGRRVLAGNAEFILSRNIPLPADLPEGGTIVHVVIDGRYAGYILLGDELKDTSAAALRRLRTLGIEKTVLLTGDRAAAARLTAESLGIDEFHAELLPGDKVRLVEELLAPDRMLAFVGDGINDAPVLTRADVGIAMGALGSDAAIEAADIVLMDDDPMKIADALAVSEKAMRIAWENILFSLLVKAGVLLLSAAGVTGMEWAAFADTGMLVLCVLNALRAMKA